jgi:hypothetical protein
MPVELNLTGNDIGKSGIIWGGSLLIFFTAAAIFCLIAFWPDKLPDIDHKGDSKYSFGFFSVKLLTPDTNFHSKAHSPEIKKDSSSKGKTDSLAKGKDSLGRSKDSLSQAADSLKTSADNDQKPFTSEGVDLNTIYLILVALVGFLGNMIHISTSFTTFVGNENFKKSWILWYFVKPFTAAALAVIVYFIIRAGFLSYGSDAKNVSLYGMLSLAALAGLFTDTATLKLKEVFDTMFKPRDERDDKLSTFKIDNIVPELLKKGNNNLSLKGKGFDKTKISMKIEGQEIKPTAVATDSIDFVYVVADAVAPGTKLTFSVFNEANKEIYKHTLTVQ